jgi:hypothetical protein
MRFSYYALLPVCAFIITGITWRDYIYGLHSMLIILAGMILISVCLLLALFNLLMLLAPKKRKTALKRLGVIFLSIFIIFVFDGDQFLLTVTKLGMSWRVLHEEKFKECRQHSKLILRHKFNKCDENDMGLGPGSDLDSYAIVYDPDMVTLNRVRQKKSWCAVQAEFGLENNFNIEDLGNGFYLLHTQGYKGGEDILCKR